MVEKANIYADIRVHGRPLHAAPSARPAINPAT
jgi:hypothetical protein